MNPYEVVEDFERELCEYTGASFAVTVTSCTMALFLTMKWWHDKVGIESVNIPKRTYVSVPQAIKHAGHLVEYREENWLGEYQLRPFPVWDAARLFTGSMYIPGHMQCVSFHWTKTLGIGQGGAILHDDPLADAWFRKARFDGRTPGIAPKDDKFDMLGWHCYMSPRDAAEGLSRLAILPKTNPPLPNDDYPELDKIKIFT